MFYVTIWQEAVEDWNDTKVRNNLQDLAASSMMVKEIIDILKDQVRRSGHNRHNRQARRRRLRLPA